MLWDGGGPYRLDELAETIGELHHTGGDFVEKDLLLAAIFGGEAAGRERMDTVSMLRRVAIAAVVILVYGTGGCKRDACHVGCERGRGWRHTALDNEHLG